MPFVQPAPEIGNQYTSDRALRGLLAHALPDEVMADIEAPLAEIGELAGVEFKCRAAAGVGRRS